MAIFALIVLGIFIAVPYPHGKGPVSAIRSLSSPSTGTSGEYAFVTNNGLASVSIINLTTNTIVKTINTGDAPQGMAVSPLSTFVWVADTGTTNVSIISTQTMKKIQTVTTPSTIPNVAISPNGSYAYLVDPGASNIQIRDLSEGPIGGTVVGDLSLGSGVTVAGNDFAITPNGTYGYFTYQSTENIVVFNLRTDSLIKAIPISTSYVNPGNMAITPNGTYVYVAVTGSSNIVKIDTHTNTVVANIALSAPVDLAITHNGSELFATMDAKLKGSYITGVLNTTTDAVVTYVPVGTSPIGIALSPNGSDAYVANNGADTISVINTTNDTVVDTINGLPSAGVYDIVTLTAPDPSTFSAFFRQTTLPSGTTWGIELSNSTSSIWKNVTGEYDNFTSLANNSAWTFQVVIPTDYLADPSSGAFTLSPSNFSETIDFSLAHYLVTFSETGLKQGTSWTVILNGSHQTSNSSSMSTNMVDGTYNWSIPALPLFVPSPSSGTVIVDGANVSISIYFTPYFFVNFTESGYNRTWSLSYNGQLYSSSTNIIQIKVPLGSNIVYINGINGYYINPMSWSDFVTHNETVSVAFTPAPPNPGLIFNSWDALAVLLVIGLPLLGYVVVRVRRG